MFEIFKMLGVVYDENNKIVNHRSLIKILLNPTIYEWTGYVIATKFDGTELGGPTLSKLTERKPFVLQEGWRIERRRMII